MSPGDRPQTGMYKHVDANGKESRIVALAGNVKVVVGTLVLVVGAIAGGAAWFNGHVQAEAIKALGTQLSEDGSNVKNAFDVLLDNRLDKTDGKIEDLEKKLDEAERRLRKMMWKATSPSRRDGDREPTDEELDN
jgi:predicted metalloprotease